MANPKRIPDSRKAGSARHLSRRPASAASLPEELARRVDAIADGRVAFPQGLDRLQLEQLAIEVARRRQNRLVQFLAQVIAQDLLSRPQDHEGGNS